MFVGSFNFDPRSVLLNTEMGLLIESPALAERLARGFDDVVPTLAYEVQLLGGDRGLEWIEVAPSGERRFTTEPATRPLRRAMVRALAQLPIEWLL